MGYRSDVAYLILFLPTENGKALFYTFLAEAKAKQETQLCFEDNDLEVDEEKLRISMQAESVKWYEDYEDVECHNALLALADEYRSQEFVRAQTLNDALREKFEKEHGKPVNQFSFDELEQRNIKMPDWHGEDIGHSFVRIGENDDDCEFRWDGWHEAYERCNLSRDIMFDLS